MRPTIFVLICVAVVLALNTSAQAQRVDIYDSSIQQPHKRTAALQELDDGGCSMMTVCAQFSSADGGAMIQSCEGVNRELKPAGGQGMCLALLDGAGKLWLNRQSISSGDSGVPDSGL